MGKFTEFKLPLKSLSQGNHGFKYHLGQTFFSDMENSDIRDADLEVDLSVNYARDRYILDFRITGDIVLLCDRCLDDLHCPVETSYHVVVEYGDDYCDDSDDLLVIPESDNYLNVAYMIYDTVALSIPMKHVHPLGKCNRQMSVMLRKHRARAAGEDADLAEELIDGMDQIEAPAQDGQPADPRWDALKDFGKGE